MEVILKMKKAMNHKSKSNGRLNCEPAIKRRWWLGILLLIASVLYLPAARLHAYSALDSYWQWGEPQRGLSARSLAMGSTGISSLDDATALGVNPALLDLGDEETNGSFSLSGGPLWFFDKRDHSHNAVTYAATDNTNFNFPSAAMLWSASRRNDFILGFGFFSDLNFDYNLEEKDSSALITDRVTAEGGFHDWVLGANWKAAPWLSVGMSYLWGVGKDDKDLILSTSSANATLLTKTSDYQELSGNSVLLGVNYSYEDVFNVGMFWRSGYEMKVKETLSKVTDNTVKISSSTKFVREMPYQMGVGATYNFGDDFDSKLVFDMIYTAWGNSKYWVTSYNGIGQPKVKVSPDFSSVTEYHFGFEHSPMERMYFRYGFSYIPDYPSVSDALAAISLGVGFTVQQVTVDVAGEYAFKEEDQKRISQIYSGFDTVTERRQQLMATLSYKW